MKNKITIHQKIYSFLKANNLSFGYTASQAWFAERLVMAGLLLASLSFAAGAIFVLQFSEPIGQSEIYSVAAGRAKLAEQGIEVFSQQVIDVASPVFTTLVKSSRDEEEVTALKLADRRQKLTAYLASKGSPFAEDPEAIEAFANSRNMKLMIAISFVESTFGKRCYYNNCSGIGGTPPNLRKYDSYAEWIRDFDDLLERRYKDLPPEEFIGLYVQPGSANWLYGVKLVLQELEALRIQ